jgi:hypothetical protein
MSEIPYPGDIPYIDGPCQEEGSREEKIEFVFDIKRNALNSEAVHRFYKLQNLAFPDVYTNKDTIHMKYTLTCGYAKIVADTLTCINEIINDPDVEVKEGWHIEHEHYYCLLYEIMKQFDKFQEHLDTLPPSPPIGWLRRTLNFFRFGKKVKAQ